MSIDRCFECEREVDTDDDAEAYGDDGLDECMCETCREKLAKGRREDERLDDPRHGQGDR